MPASATSLPTLSSRRAGRSAGPAVRTDQVPVVPGVAGGLPLPVLIGEVLAERLDQLGGIGTARLRLPFGRKKIHPPWALRAGGSALRCNQMAQNCGHFPPWAVHSAGHGLLHTCLRPAVRRAFRQSGGHGYRCSGSPQACGSGQACR